MNVLLFGTYDESRHPRVAVLRQGLEAAGSSVSVLNESLRDSTSDRIDAARSPRAAIGWLTQLMRAWLRLWRRSIRIESPDVVVVGYLGVLDVVLARMRWPRNLIVLDHLAPLSGVAVDRHLGRAARVLLGLADRIAELCANLVVFDTADNADLSATPASKQVVVAVGAPEEWYAATGAMERQTDSLKVVFFGLFTPLQGATTIGEAISRTSDVSIEFTMVGAGQDLEVSQRSAGDTPGVEWIDWVESSELPSLVASHDVCLGIFGTTPKASLVVPNKVFQGAAAGCAIVTLDSVVQREVLGDAAMYVPAGDASALADALRNLGSDRELLRRYQVSARAIAESFRPEQVVGPLVDAIERATGSNMRSSRS